MSKRKSKQRCDCGAACAAVGVLMVCGFLVLWAAYGIGQSVGHEAGYLKGVAVLKSIYCPGGKL